MKSMTIAAMTLASILFQMGQTFVPVEREPRHHLKFENDFVRVFDVRVPAGDATLFHLHSHDYVFVTIGDAKLRAEAMGGNPVDLATADGEVRFTRAPLTHRVTNVGDGLFRNITIEILKSTGVAVSDSVTDVRGTTLVLENDRVRIERLNLEPGKSTGSHTHSRSGLAVVVSGGTLVVESPGSQPQTVQLTPGQFQWLDGPVTHALENAGTTAIEVVHIDWK